MNGFDLVFDPFLPLWLLAAAAVLAAGFVAFGLWRRASGIGWRALALAVILLALAGPSIIAEEREHLPNEVVVIADRTPSQEIDDRTGRTDRILEELHAKLGTAADLTVRDVALDADPDVGTALFDQLGRTLGDVDRQRLAGSARRCTCS